MMNRGTNSAKDRKRVKAGGSSTKLDILTPPPLVRSNTLPNHTSAPRISRGNSLGLPDKEKARSDDGFHSDSDKDSNQSANSNISIKKPPSIKSSNVVAKVRPKSSIGTMSDNSLSDRPKVELDIFNLNRQEAKNNRKIEDLEISRQSLMRFNAELEATNKKQAAEIEELKRKLQIDNSLSSIYESEDDPSSQVDSIEIEKDNNTRFRRICILIDELTQNAEKALTYTSKIGVSVITNAQLDSKNTKFQEHESDNLVLSNSLVPKEMESNLEEKSNIDKITYETKSNLNVTVNEQTFVNDPKIKLTTEKDNTNSITNNLSITELSEEKNQRLQANLERARTVANELLTLEKQDNNVNNNTSYSSERKGLGLLLPVQSGHSPRSSISGSDSPQPSPRMILLYQLQESLGIGNSESSKYLKENRRSLPVISQSRNYFSVIPESKEEGDSRSSVSDQTQSSRRSSSSRTQSFPPTNMSKGIKDHIKKDESVLSPLPHGSEVEKRSSWASSMVFAYIDKAF